jgi:hypothetical protein
MVEVVLGLRKGMVRMGEVEWIWIYIFVVGGKGGG